MKGFIRRSMALVCLAAGVPIMGGCTCYRDIVDPCWPERYNAVARHSVNDTFDAQALNGHILDQTLWNYHFMSCWVEVPDPTPCNCVKVPDIRPCNPEATVQVNNDKKQQSMKIQVPTAELNYAGKKKLEYLVQRLPGPDGRVYLQTAFDLPIGTPTNQIVEKTRELNEARARAIREYLAVLTAGYQQHPVAFEVAVHNRPEPTVPALPHVGAQRPTPVGALTDNWNQYLGSIPISPIFGGSSGTP